MLTSDDGDVEKCGRKGWNIEQNSEREGSGRLLFEEFNMFHSFVVVISQPGAFVTFGRDRWSQQRLVVIFASIWMSLSRFSGKNSYDTPQKRLTATRIP